MLFNVIEGQRKLYQDSTYGLLTGYADSNVMKPDLQQTSRFRKTPPTIRIASILVIGQSFYQDAIGVVVLV